MVNWWKIVLLSLFIQACTDSGQQSDLGSYLTEELSSGGTGFSGPLDGDVSDPTNNAPPIQAGQLTAADWDDNLNFDLFTALLTKYFAGASKLTPLAPIKREPVKHSPCQLMDLAFVVDATGSMVDELEYLKKELQSTIERIKIDSPGVSIRIALVFYRDQGDEYMTRTFGFSESIPQIIAHLQSQFANGGGDFPEAVDQALSESIQLQWRSGANVRRMLFLMGDAPPHQDKITSYLQKVEQLKSKDIHVYSIAASGIDTEAEILFRFASQQTLGRYLFLTDDSGIGDTHKDPEIPCYHVQLLNKLLNRLIISELKGEYIPPTAVDIIRTVGEVDEGKCHSDDIEIIGRIY